MKLETPMEYRALYTEAKRVIWQHKEEYSEAIYKREYPSFFDFAVDMRDKFGSRFSSKLEKVLRSKGRVAHLRSSVEPF